MAVQTIDDSEVYTTKQVAEFAGLKDDGNIRRLLIDGVIKGRKVGRQWLVTGRDLRSWLESRERG